MAGGGGGGTGRRDEGTQEAWVRYSRKCSAVLSKDRSREVVTEVEYVRMWFGMEESYMC
jgi:uncharacterized protein (DUF2461 family)